MRLQGKCVFLVPFCFFAAAVYGQDCPVSLTYTPAAPVLGQPITATFTVLSTPAPTATSGSTYLSSISATESGVPPIQSTPGTFDVFPTPSSYSFTFTPYEPGQVTVSAHFPFFYSYGQTPLCGIFLDSAPVTITIPGPPPPGPLNALNGQYAFLFQGSIPQAKGTAQTLASVGSFTADGNGNIVAGVEDVNSGLGSFTQVSFTGTYTLDATGHGTLHLKGAGGDEQLRILIPYFTPTNNVAKASLFADNGYALFGEGVLMKQYSSTSFTGQYQVTLRGDLPCSATCVSGQPVYESGLLSFLNGTTISGDLLASGGAVAVPDIAASGTYGQVDPITGRFTYSLSQGQFPNLNLVGYLVDGIHFFTLSTDSHRTTYLLSGSGEE